MTNIFKVKKLCFYNSK